MVLEASGSNKVTALRTRKLESWNRRPCFDVIFHFLRLLLHLLVFLVHVIVFSPQSPVRPHEKTKRTASSHLIATPVNMDAKLDKLRDRARFNSPSPDGRSSGEDAGRKLSNLLTGRRKSRGAKKNDATNSPERWGIVTADTAASGGSTPGSLVATRDQEDDEHDEDGNHQVSVERFLSPVIPPSWTQQ